MNPSARMVVVRRWFEENRDLKADDVMMIEQDGETLVPLFTNKALARAGADQLQEHHEEELEPFYVSSPEYLSSILAELGHRRRAVAVLVNGVERSPLHAAIIALETAW